MHRKFVTRLLTDSHRDAERMRDFVLCLVRTISFACEHSFSD
jgi:hypothetical protein